MKLSPRLGLVHSFNRRPCCAPATASTGRRGTIRASAPPTTVTLASASRPSSTRTSSGPTSSFTESVPERRAAARGNALGALAGVGGEIDFIDQDKKAPLVHQYLDRCQPRAARQHGDRLRVPGATGRDLGLGGSNDGVININQLDPRHLSLGRRCSRTSEPVLRPAGRAGLQRDEPDDAAPRSCCGRSRSSTTSSCARRRSGKSQYHAGIFKFEKRVTNGWGGRMNYTYSRLKDNQFGENNFFSRELPTEAQNAYDFDAEYSHRPARRAAQDRDRADHRVAVRRRQALGDRAASPRTSSATGRSRRSSRFESGFPISLSAQHATRRSIFTRMQRATSGTGDPRDRRKPHDRCGCIRRTVAERLAGLHACRRPVHARHIAAHLDDVRTPHRNNWDFVASKDVRFGGSRPRQDQARGAEHHQHGQGSRSRSRVGTYDVRPDPHAVRIHAADAADVPDDVLRSGPAAGGIGRAAASAAETASLPSGSGRAHAL